MNTEKLPSILENFIPVKNQKTLMEGLLAGKVYINKSAQYLLLWEEELAILCVTSINSHYNPVRQFKAESRTDCPEEIAESLKSELCSKQHASESLQRLIEEYGYDVTQAALSKLKPHYHL